MHNSAMKHLIMGTAGHIDHGKTALVKALTGIECDTHKQEKQRGITINLGFAHLPLSKDNIISIIDVPGHKDFIHTMVSGASGIDFVCMVIAADSGIMPQTQEHLQIINMLNISQGIIVLTKIDTVDQEMRMLALEEITEFKKGTFLEHAPIIPVSSLTGEGIVELKRAINSCAQKVTKRSIGDLFRLFIDRIFTISGFGTVITGSVIDGKLHHSDPVYLFPSGKKLRIRRLERHGKEVDTVEAGDRASINLVGLNRENFIRGMTIANRLVEGTQMVDAYLTLFPQARNISLWSSSIFLIGTYEAQVKIHLLDKNSVRKGESVLVQIHLPKPCIIKTGDRFIIRSTSNDRTLGGGRIIDPMPLHHKRRPQKLINTLSNIVKGNVEDLITGEIRKSKTILTPPELARKLNSSEDTILDAITKKLPGDIFLYGDQKVKYLLLEEINKNFKKRVLNQIKAFHKNHPMENRGMSVKEMVPLLGLTSNPKNNSFTNLLLNSLVTEGQLKQREATWALVSHEVNLTKEFHQKALLVENFFKEQGLKVASSIEISSMASNNNIDDTLLKEILTYLTKNKNLFFEGSDYVHSEIVNRIKPKLLNALYKNPEGLTVAAFRDLISTSRKICLRLFSIYDKEGITIRKNDVRVLTEKGRTLLAKS